MPSRASPVTHALHVVHSDLAFACGTHGPVCIVIWRGPVTEARFQVQRVALADVAARYGPRAGYLCIIEPAAPPPPPELRKMVTTFMSAHEKELCCAALVLEGTGFQVALTRSVMLGMTVIAGQRSYPVSYVATVREAAERIHGLVSVVPDSLERDVETLRSRLDEA